MKRIRKHHTLLRLLFTALFCLALVLQVSDAKATDYIFTITLYAARHGESMPTTIVGVDTSPKTQSVYRYVVKVYRNGVLVNTWEQASTTGGNVTGLSTGHSSSFTISNDLPSAQMLRFECYAYSLDGTQVAYGENTKEQPIIHENGAPYNTPATCTDPGYSNQLCSICGYVTRTEIPGEPALGHDYGLWSTYVHDSTTSGSGSKHYRACLRSGCGYREVSSCDLRRIGTIPATCTASESIVLACSLCSYMYSAEQGEPLGHSFTNYISDGNATCTHDGTKTAVCDRCTDTDTIADTGSALGHSFTNYIPDGNAACTLDGTKTAVCDRCTETDTIADTGSALGHDFDPDAARDVPATCTAQGLKAYTCSRCPEHDDVTIPALGHDYETVVTPPICTADGYTTNTCTRIGCGDTYTDNVTSALGHDFQHDAARDVPAACTTQGLKAYTCSRCPEQGDIVTAAPGHTYNAVVTQPACTTGGYTTHTCTRCGDTFTDSVTAALGHDFQRDAARDIPAACTAQGLKAYTCSRCPEHDDITTTALGHDDIAVVTPPTCTAGGFTTHTCARCGDSYTDSFTPRLSHWYGDWTPDGEGTHSADCVREGCTHHKTVTCSPQEYQVNRKTLTLCSVCGGTSSGERLLPVDGAGAQAVTKTLPRGDLTLRRGTLGDGTELLSIAFEHAANLEQPTGKVRFSLPADAFLGYSFRLIKADGSADDIPYTLHNGVLTFELDFTPVAGTAPSPAVLIQLIPPAD